MLDYNNIQIGDKIDFGDYIIPINDECQIDWYKRRFNGIQYDIPINMPFNYIVQYKNYCSIRHKKYYIAKIL